jgi:hypothetical protein
VAETINIAEIAARLSKDIFRHFLWDVHPKTDDNFPCTNPNHLGERGAAKTTHPGDAVFSYRDPYLGKNIYLHTDLKSYKKDSITSTKLRQALQSLCMTVDCARSSSDWRNKYSVDPSEPYDVRGLLFVHNYDAEYLKEFSEVFRRIDLQALPIEAGTQLHFLGPTDIQNLYSIANDMLRLKANHELPDTYTFYYPDLVLSRRQGDVWDQPATIETLTGPYIIIKHGAFDRHPSGYLIYYNSPANSVEEFEYFLDSLSRFQMLEKDEKIRIRVTRQGAPDDLTAIFHTAKKKYVKAWGFDSARESMLDAIEVERIASVTSTYNPGDMGWRT